MSAITIMLIILVALLAGMEGILDEFQFHQPLVACTLIGLVSGHLSEGIILGGSLQMIALGWANVGAAVAPDAALASVASAIIMVLGLNGGTVNSYLYFNCCCNSFISSWFILNYDLSYNRYPISSLNGWCC
mgnify:CR=1 FL=1